MKTSNTSNTSKLRIVAALVIAAALAVAALAQAAPTDWCWERLGYGDYQCNGIYGGITYPSGAVTRFYNNALPFDERVSAWYMTGCNGEQVIFDTHIPPHQTFDHFAFDYPRSRPVLYTWCAVDARPSFSCWDGEARPYCVGGQ